MNSGAALVGRPGNQGVLMKTMRVKIVRPFYYDRKVQKSGDIVELPAVFAVEMIAANKAEGIEPEPAPATAPTEEETPKKRGAAKS